MLLAYQSKLCEFYIYLGDEIGVVKFIVIVSKFYKNLRGKSLKFKQTLPQKFKQIPSKALNSITLINFCHTDLVLAILINSVILSEAKYPKTQSVLKFYGFFALFVVLNLE